MSTEELTFKSILNGLSLPTLEEISIMALAIRLLESEEIRKICFQYFSAKENKIAFPYSKVGQLTSSCLKSLQLPEIIQAKLTSGFYWIMDQYINWIEDVNNYYKPSSNEKPNSIQYFTFIMNSVQWSMGEIDKKKSMHQVFLMEERIYAETKYYAISDETMFSVASKFCLEDKIKDLWESMKEKYRDYCVSYDNECNYINHYWGWYKMRKNEEEYMKWISRLIDEYKYLEELMNNEDPNTYAFVVNIFEGEVSGVKYFKKLVNVDEEQMVLIIKTFINNRNFLIRYEDVQILHFLLKEIEDEEILNGIFQEFFEDFLKISIEYWPWHKCFFPLLKIFVDKINQVLFYDLINQLLENSDIVTVKMLWKNVPYKLKKEFCLFISNKQKNRDVVHFWSDLKIDVFEMFVKDEELSSILTPYENYGILGCIFTSRYDLIEHWLQKFLVSEEALVSYINNFLLEKSVGVMKSFPMYRSYSLGRLNQFLDWAFKYEDMLSRDEIFKIKDRIINDNIIELFRYGFCNKQWEDLKKIIDWMVRNRNDEYENDLVSLKQKSIEKLSFDGPCNFSDDFKNSLCDFLSYGVKDPGKVQVMMSEVNMSNEGIVCSENLLSDFSVIDRYLRFLEEHGRDVFLTKEKTLYYIFENFKWSDAEFENNKYWKNIRKLLYWNCENDPEIEKKVEGIKKTIINKYALEWILKCVNNYSSSQTYWTNSNSDNKWVITMNNILKFLFEGKLEDEEWQTMLFDLKTKVIDKLNGDDKVWREKFYYDDIKTLINCEKENEDIRERNWEIKKSFIECLKNNIKAYAVLKFILNYKFFSSFFKGDENMADFKKIMRDLKESLVNKVISDEDYELTCNLIENLKGVSKFLNWHGFDEEMIQNFQIKIFDEKGKNCCLFWIRTGKLKTVSAFFKWCSAANSNYDWKSKISELKNNVLNIAVCQYSEHWSKEFFKELDKFISLLYKVDEKDVKFYKTVDECIIKSCAECVRNANYDGLIEFIKWAEIEGEEIINNFKRNVLIEFLNAEKAYIWEDRNTRYYCRRMPDLDLDEFIYSYAEPDRVKIANMKLDVLEIHFLPVFKKLFHEKDPDTFERFLGWSFDNHMKSGKCLRRTRKLIREIFEKSGKEFFIATLTTALRSYQSGCEVKAVQFWDFCFDSKTGIKIPESELWTLKMDCINQVLMNEIEKTVEDDYKWSGSLDDQWSQIVNTFLSLGSTSPDLKNKIAEYKDFLAQKYGVACMELYFKCLLKDADISIPEDFIEWLFEKVKVQPKSNGGKKGKGKKQKKEDETYLDEEKLLNFKKQVLETLVNIKHEDLLGKDYFYDALEKFFKFKLSPQNSNVMNDLKKSVCEVQGVELCVNLMCQNNGAALERFLSWVKNLFGSNFNDFKNAVDLQCAGDLLQRFDAYFRN